VLLIHLIFLFNSSSRGAIFTQVRTPQRELILKAHSFIRLTQDERSLFDFVLTVFAF
jgi:hypothetical protein